MAIGLLTGILAGKVAYDAITRFIDFWHSDAYFLKEFKAVPLTEETAPRQLELLSALAQKAQIPVPKLYVIDDEYPNAFAVGRDSEHAAVCVTKALLCNLSLAEQEGILGHEVTHIKNKDILILTAAAFLKDFAVSAIPGSVLGSKGISGKSNNNKVALAAVSMLGSLIMGSVLEQALSRRREFDADKGSGELTEAPEVLADALEKIDFYTRNMLMRHANASNAHLFFVCPAGYKLRDMFNSHPPVEERARRLREQAVAMGKKIAQNA